MIAAGFVGGGFMGEVHTRAARAARARLSGIVSSSPSRGQIAAERLGVEHSFATLEEMLADPSIDVIHVLTPNALHAEQALAVIAAGKHVICEKPLAVSSVEADQLVAAAREAGVTATVPFVYRFHPMVREARARVQAGDTGRLFTINGSYLQDWLLDQADHNWRVDAATGGASRAFADIGSHLVDLIEFVTGERITRVAASLRTFFDTRVGSSHVGTEDADAVVFETSGGAIGTLLVSQVAAGRKNALRLDISGSRESLSFDQEHPDSLWVGRRKASLTVPRDPAHLHPDAARLSVVPGGHPQGYQEAFAAFIGDSYASIAGEARDGLPRFEDGLRAVRITEAVIQASTSGQWVEIEEVPNE
ncbi:Gfo/Idh/MocA family protein [Homoserinimonas aerilata]|nr:Gfo/Idh/MocA family oxidoreductase [Homoserinimonas aerilata]